MTILTNPSKAELAAAVQENLFALFRAMMVLPGSEMVETPQVSYHHAFPSNPMFKGVWATHLAAEETDGTISKVLDWYKTRQSPFVFWWVGTDSQPSELPERLQAHGFGANIMGDPGMVANLHDLNEAIQTPEGFTITPATNQTMLEDWGSTFSASFEVPAWAGQAWVEATSRLGISRAPWQLYLGYWNGKPVATNILFNGAGVASVYGVGTLPEARGNGIGAAITLKPLQDAREQGYRYAVLFSTEMGYSVYQRLGFRPVDCKIARYLWINPQ